MDKAEREALVQRALERLTARKARETPDKPAENAFGPARLVKG